MRILKAYKGEEPLKGVFHGLSIIWPTNLEYFTRIVRDNLGGIYDEALFTSEFNNLPTLAKIDSEVILVPGAYKSGFIYGVNRNGFVVPFTFARAGVATYFDKDGIMQTAAANMPRIDYAPLTKVCKGYLQESASTNLNIYSSPSNATGAVTNGVIYEATDIIGFPRKMLLNRTSGTINYYYAPTGGLLASTDYVMSVYVRMLDGSEPIVGASSASTADMVIMIAQFSQSPTNVNKEHLGNGLWRLWTTRATSDTPPFSNSGVLKYSANSEKSFNVYFIQIEKGTSPSSPIHTNGSQVTRPADTIQSVTDIVPYAEASVFMNFSATSSTNASFLTKGASNFMYTSGLFVFRIYDGVNVASSSTAFNQGVQIKAASSYGSRGLRILKSGDVFGTYPPYNNNMNNGSVLIFSKPGGGGMKMYIKALAIFSRQLTDEEHTTITT